MPALRKSKKELAAIEIKKLFTNGLIDKGWTQLHLAKLMNKQPGVISRAINNPFRREFELLFDIALLLIVSYEYAEIPLPATRFFSQDLKKS